VISIQRAVSLAIHPDQGEKPHTSIGNEGVPIHGNRVECLGAKAISEWAKSGTQSGTMSCETLQRIPRLSRFLPV
jgi:hypothetical protein